MRLAPSMPSRISLRRGRHPVEGVKETTQSVNVKWRMGRLIDKPKDFGAREWGMDEQTDGSFWQDLSQKNGSQQEMIIMDPNQIAYTIIVFNTFIFIPLSGE